MTGPTLTFGIDPGISGAICVMHNDRYVDVIDAPTITLGKAVKGKARKRQLDCKSMADWIVDQRGVFSESVAKRTSWEEYINNSIIKAYIEVVHSMPGQGVTSTFNFGLSYGMIQGVFIASGVEVVPVTSQAWKKHFNLIGSQKDDARILAMEMFPEAPLSRKKDIGRADALLIGAYGSHLTTKDLQ